MSQFPEEGYDGFSAVPGWWHIHSATPSTCVLKQKAPIVLVLAAAPATPPAPLMHPALPHLVSVPCSAMVSYLPPCCARRQPRPRGLACSRPQATPCDYAYSEHCTMAYTWPTPCGSIRRAERIHTRACVRCRRLRPRAIVARSGKIQTRGSKRPT
ncbi:hypothetical protein EDB83DRAFT_1009177 [Lactarius deliciosus]|nr:hypothetical protein EDB83DRAFT_1009177 [Lactarius deliciosus]